VAVTSTEEFERGLSLTGYIPQRLARRLAAGAISSAETSAEFGAFLLSDIAGFTTHVEQLSIAGSVGVERFTAAMDHYFATMAEIITATGGDVLSIAGDSFLCSWPAANEAALTDAVVAAAGAALEVQRRLHRYPIDGERVIETRIGLAAGPHVTALAGGADDRWEIVTGGAEIDALTIAEGAARSGDVIATPMAAQLLAQHASLRPVGDGFAVVSSLLENRPARSEEVSTASSVELSLDALRPYLPPFARAMDQVHDPRWLAEFRRVTVLIAKPSGLTNASSLDLPRLQRSVELYQRIVRRYEGSSEVLIDSKGIVMFSVFGLPPMSHADDAGRAVRAGMDLLDGFAELNEDVSIGVASGRAFCGLLGSDVRRHYSIAGNVVNLAARLMQASHQNVLCDRNSAQSVHEQFSFQVMNPITVKGRSDQVMVYRPSGRVMTQQALRPMVGRDQQRDQLIAHLDSLANGEGSVAVVMGEAGIGKSRFIAEFTGSTSSRGVRLLVAAADSVERSTSYFAWRGVINDLLGVRPDDTAADMSSALSRRLGTDSDLLKLAPLLSSILGGQIDDSPFTASMSGDARAANTARLIVEILRAQANERPTALVVEDAHWLDSASMDVLVKATSGIPTLLAVITTRPSPEVQPADLERLMNSGGAELFQLEPLTPDQTMQLAANSLGIDRVPDELRAFIIDRAAGHPFFCEQLLNSMVESAALRVSGRTCTVGTLDWEALPTTVEGVIISRLDRLSQSEQWCLKTGAVLGRTFDADVLRSILPSAADHASVDQHLAALVATGLITNESPGTYSFGHVITRDVTYAAMTSSQRQPLHGSAAAWYEASSTDDRRLRVALLAHHWMNAGEPARAVPYLEQAGFEALRTGLNQQALLFFGRAEEAQTATGIKPEQLVRARWIKGKATAHYFLGDMPKSTEYFHQALAIFDRRVPHGKWATWFGFVRGLIIQAIHRAWPSHFVGRRADRAAPLNDAVDCYATLTRINYLNGLSRVETFYPTVKGLNVAESAGPSAKLAVSLSQFSVLWSLLGRNRLSGWYARRATQLAESLGPNRAPHNVWSNYALACASRGAWAEGIGALDRALEIILNIGDVNMQAYATQTRSAMQLCSGHFAAASESWFQTREIGRRANNTQLVAWGLLDEVQTLIGRDEVTRAASVLEEALATPTAPTDGSSAIEKEYTEALVAAAQRRWEHAIAHADIVVQTVAAKPPTGFPWVEFCADSLDIYLRAAADDTDPWATANRADLIRKARAGRKVLKGTSSQFWHIRPRVQLVSGRLALIDGKQRRAEHAFASAMRSAEKLGMEYTAAVARFELGSATSDDESKVRLQEAIDVFSRLGAIARLREASAVLASR
jgi:class 3 adenylate cyclase/tetratricopeptide (TPR) repeat protein